MQEPNHTLALGLATSVAEHPPSALSSARCGSLLGPPPGASNPSLQLQSSYAAAALAPQRPAPAAPLLALQFGRAASLAPSAAFTVALAAVPTRLLTVGAQRPAHMQQVPLAPEHRSFAPAPTTAVASLPALRAFASRGEAAVPIALEGAISSVTYAWPSAPSTRNLDLLRSWASTDNLARLTDVGLPASVVRCVSALVSRAARTTDGAELCVAEVAAASWLAHPLLVAAGAPPAFAAMNHAIAALLQRRGRADLARQAESAGPDSSRSAVSLKVRVSALAQLERDSRGLGAAAVGGAGSGLSSAELDRHAVRKATNASHYLHSQKAAGVEARPPKPDANDPHALFTQGPYAKLDTLPAGVAPTFLPRDPLLLRTHPDEARELLASAPGAPPLSESLREGQLANIFDASAAWDQHVASGCPRCARGDCSTPSLLQSLHSVKLAFHEPSLPRFNRALAKADGGMLSRDYAVDDENARISFVAKGLASGLIAPATSALVASPVFLIYKHTYAPGELSPARLFDWLNGIAVPRAPASDAHEYILTQADFIVSRACDAATAARASRVHARFVMQSLANAAVAPKARLVMDLSALLNPVLAWFGIRYVSIP